MDLVQKAGGRPVDDKTSFSYAGPGVPMLEVEK